MNAFSRLKCPFLVQFIHMPAPQCYWVSATEAFFFLPSPSILLHHLNLENFTFYCQKTNKTLFSMQEITSNLLFPIFINMGGHLETSTYITLNVCLGAEWMLINWCGRRGWVNGCKGPWMLSYGFWTICWKLWKAFCLQMSCRKMLPSPKNPIIKEAMWYREGRAWSIM